MEDNLNFWEMKNNLTLCKWKLTFRFQMGHDIICFRKFLLSWEQRQFFFGKRRQQVLANKRQPHLFLN
jgi:hypothetical protein